MNIAAAIGNDASGSGVYLRAALAPLADVLACPDVSDIYINRPGEFWVEAAGEVKRFDNSELDEVVLIRLARQIAAYSHQGVSREHPLLSAVLPDGCRVQIVTPPAAKNSLALAIRKQVASSMTVLDYSITGGFAETTVGEIKQSRSIPRQIVDLVNRNEFASALVEAVGQRLNILISGGTSSGKTTFLNALLREIPDVERLITIEDTPEIHLRQPNHVNLIAARGRLGEAQVDANDLVAAALRMRPDRIVLGELRGSEALAFLRAVNSGHAGSMTTIHAGSPESAVEQLVLLGLQAGTALTRADIRHYVQQTIDVYVQLNRRAGTRFIERIAMRGSSS